MSGDQQVVCGKIEALIALMLRGVAEEDMPTRAGVELISSGGKEVRVEGVSKGEHRREWCRRGENGVRGLRSLW
jgi:glycerate-2-kinase